ncbi:MAG: 50S ribosomal protein L28 [Deltaproteobacteria bacterium]|nr:50S ribosomal protein L28 [Deltaproteobacteria bacterium]
MARICEICGKRRQVGMNVSHAHNRTKKVWNPNLQRVRIVTDTGSVRRARVCTSCITRGAVVKAVSA